MKTALAGVVLLIACLLTASCYAQSSSYFQSVGGDYGKSVIGTLKTKDPQPAASSDNKSSLWSWGSAPKGSLILDNNLVTDPRYSAKKLNVTNNWLGDSLVDPYGSTPEYSYTDPKTGMPVKTYVDPNTGQSYYTYTDSKTGKLVYVYFNPETGEPLYVSFTPVGGISTETNDFTLPPIFNSNDPWSQSS
jgi:hypothetical protein